MIAQIDSELAAERCICVIAQTARRPLASGSNRRRIWACCAWPRTPVYLHAQRTDPTGRAGTRFAQLVQVPRRGDRAVRRASRCHVRSASLAALGKARIAEHLVRHRDMHRYLHDQTLRLANKGLTPTEIAAEVRLPPSLVTPGAPGKD